MSITTDEARALTGKRVTVTYRITYVGRTEPSIETVTGKLVKLTSTGGLLIDDGGTIKLGGFGTLPTEHLIGADAVDSITAAGR